MAENGDQKPKIEDSPSEPKSLRRELFSLGPAALAAAFLAACSQDNAKFGGVTGRRDLRKTANGAGPDTDDPEGDGTNDALGAGEGNPNDILNKALPCTSLSQFSALLALSPDLPAISKPTLRFYGSKSSALVAVGFPSYLESPAFKIASVSLLDEDGYPLASHVITAADRSTTTGKLNLFCLDNLSLIGTKVHLLVSTADNLSFKQKDILVTFDDPKAAGKKLVETSPVKASFVRSFQGIGNFQPLALTLHKRSNVFVAGIVAPPNDQRFFYLAASNTQFLPATGLTGFMITDLLGESLGDGAAFAGILQNTNFIAYRESGDMVYRTIIRMT
jgi:hypothetical protein